MQTEANNNYREIVDFLIRYEEVDYFTIKSNMRKIRESKGISPMYLERSGLLSVGVVRQLEKTSYRYKPSLESLIKYCSGLDIRLIELL